MAYRGCDEHVAVERYVTSNGRKRGPRVLVTDGDERPALAVMR